MDNQKILDFAQKIEEAKSKDIEALFELGKVFQEARAYLTQTEFKKLLELENAGIDLYKLKKKLLNFIM